MTENWLDRFIGFFSPMARYRRIQARQALELVSKRKLDAAGKGNRLKSWNTDSSDAVLELKSSLSVIRSRMRDLVKNNPYARRAVNVIVHNTIGGWGIVPQFKSNNSRKRAEVEKLWNEWADDIRVDYDEKHDFYGLQSLIMSSVVVDGEVLVKPVINPRNGKRIPLEFQTLEGDFIDDTRDNFARGAGENFVTHGIEFSPERKRQAYWLYNEHPGGDFNIFNRSKLNSQRIPKENIIHPYMVERPGQIRGVPWGVAAVVRLKDFHDYEEAQLLRQKIAACFAGFITESEMPINQDAAKSIINEKIEPGSMEVLPPGRDIRFGNPPNVEGYDIYTLRMIQSIAIAFGVTYESISSDYGNVNFSSGRMGHLEFQRNLDTWRWKFYIPQVLNEMWRWFVNAATIAGHDVSGVVPSWTPPRREMIDPVKETEAAKDAVRSGFKSLPETIREMGYDPDQVFDEIQQTNAKLDNSGIILDSDPRKISGSGGTQSSGNGTNSGGN